MSEATIWQGPSESIPAVNTNGNIYEETHIATAGQTVFNLLTFTYTPDTKSIFVVRDGFMLRRAVDFTETDSDTVTAAIPAAGGERYTFMAFAIAQVNPPVTLNGLPPAGNANQILQKTDGTDYNTRWVDLSSISSSLLDGARQNVASAPTIDLSGAIKSQTRNIQITGVTQIDGFIITNGELWAVKFASALTLKNNANIVTNTGTDISVRANDTCIIRATADNVIEVLCYATSVASITPRSNVRQTVQAGPITGAGLPNPGGATGATVVTTTNISAANPWVVNAADGVNGDRLGIATANLSYTGLNVNGTMYLFNDIDASGNITTAVSAVAPTYQEAGAGSVINTAFTFNIASMTGTVGNGAAANAAYRVCVGQVTVAAGVVSAITWYAYNGRYDSGWTAGLPGVLVQLSAPHNLGTRPEDFGMVFENTIAQHGYQVGDQIKNESVWTADGTGRLQLSVLANTLSVTMIATGSAGSIQAGTSAGTAGTLTSANWKRKFYAKRGW